MHLRSKIVGFFCLIICLLGVCGCGERQPLSVAEFNTVMEEKDFAISDVTEHVKADYVEAISLAVKEDYQIEFYVFSDKDAASSVLEQNRSVFESDGGNKAAGLTKNIGNYSFFSLQSDGVYRMVARIDNTMLYVVADERHKEEIVDIIKELGY